ncbi:MAG: alkyl hydroperoxide reductase subunit F [Prevotella sp.]|nr:alkyl hydroperoxide reductase subunit F [Prevotella sp.]MCM1075376.1 alkyl hydroperoxide reductase subunit F [Ruminococcus sp.]
MTLDKNILSQLTEIFKMLSSPVEFHILSSEEDEKSVEMTEFIEQLCSTSSLLSFSKEKNEKPGAEFSIFHAGTPTRITFRGIPGGHEFNSLLMAILNSDGKGKNLPDDVTRKRIESLNAPIALTTFVSLSCTNCPDVVQALNIVALLNDGVTHTIIDGGAYPNEADKLGVQAVPSVYVGDKLFSVGKATLGELLDKLENGFGTKQVKDSATPAAIKEFDMLILGGGPAGVSAAIYGARKGLTVGIITREGGGSVSLTGSIDNLITTRTTTGDTLAAELTGNAAYYGAQIYDNRTVSEVNLTEPVKTIRTSSGEIFSSKRLIIATGATPRHLNIPGESEYIGRGVAFCPHCDGPYFKGKDVVIVGGGNAGIEAAIDLAGLCRHVIVLEFLPEMKADEVLLRHLASLSNVDTFVNRQVVEIVGNGKKVTNLMVKNRETQKDYDIAVDGIFIQIGTVPNSNLFEDKLEMNKHGEIITDRHCRTSVSGVYAAGDVATSPFKQIVVAIGEGATAALSAFEDMIH